MEVADTSETSSISQPHNLISHFHHSSCFHYCSSSPLTSFHGLTVPKYLASSSIFYVVYQVLFLWSVNCRPTSAPPPLPLAPAAPAAPYAPPPPPPTLLRQPCPLPPASQLQWCVPTSYIYFLHPSAQLHIQHFRPVLYTSFRFSSGKTHPSHCPCPCYSLYVTRIQGQYSPNCRDIKGGFPWAKTRWLSSTVLHPAWYRCVLAQTAVSQARWPQCCMCSSKEGTGHYLYCWRVTSRTDQLIWSFVAENFRLRK